MVIVVGNQDKVSSSEHDQIAAGSLAIDPLPLFSETSNHISATLTSYRDRNPERRGSDKRHRKAVEK